MHTNMSRRSMLGLSGLGLAAIALPSLRPRRASAAPITAPQRLLCIFTPCGTVGPKFWPTGTETAFTLGPILAPLADFKSRMLVLRGLDMKSASAGPGNSHTKGIGQLLTGTPLLEGTLVDGMGRLTGYAGGISVDQQIASVIGKDTPLGSIPAGVRVEVPATPVRARLSYRGPNQPETPADDPFALFERVYGGLSGSKEEHLRRIAERKSVLDHSREELQSLYSRVSSEDRARFEAHVASIAEVEKALGGATGCTAPTAPAKFDVRAALNYPKVSRFQLDILASAFACDVTRVASMLYSSSQSGQIFPWLGIGNRNHHDFSHDSTAGEQLTKINAWYAGEIAYFCKKLSELPDVDGRTVLDNTLIVWMNEMSDGLTHNMNDIPTVLIGGTAAGAGVGGLRMGRYVQYADAPHNNLLVSLCNAYGISMTTFGDARFCTGPLARLT